jgi:hypothetical protein
MPIDIVLENETFTTGQLLAGQVIVSSPKTRKIKGLFYANM